MTGPKKRPRHALNGCKDSMIIRTKQVQKGGKYMHKKREKRPKKGYKTGTKRGTLQD